MPPPGPVNPVIAVVGPTAAGKSGLSLRLARSLGGEVVNADSMQLYRGMDIGTAKLTPAQRGGVPHHLLDIWEVTRTASVSEYQRLARQAIGGIRARGRIPIVVGGSGLYVRAVLDNLEFPGTDPGLRDRLEGELAEVGPAALHARLARLDPAAAAAILPGNGRRIVRALEVVELSGRPFSATLPGYESVYDDVVQVGVRVPRAQLDERIASRVAGMWQEGFVAEAAWPRRACARGGPPAGRSATRRCCASWPGSGRRSRPPRRPCGPRSGSRAARSRGSGAIRGLPGWTARTWPPTTERAWPAGPWIRSGHAVCQGPRDRERLPDPARSR
jgi:tRNA dimethylallyltransferase